MTGWVLYIGVPAVTIAAIAAWVWPDPAMVYGAALIVFLAHHIGATPPRRVR